jgi:hypothetical protein
LGRTNYLFKTTNASPVPAASAFQQQVYRKQKFFVKNDLDVFSAANTFRNVKNKYIRAGV